MKIQLARPDVKGETSTPHNPDSGKAIMNSPLFIAPTEIRSIVYGHVLVSSKPINKLHEFLDSGTTATMNNSLRIPDINTAIVRTCHRINDKTMLILYGNNIFVFGKAKHIRKFEEHGLITFPPSK